MESNDADQYARLAMDCHQRGELDQAIGYYQKLLAIKPGFAQAHYNLGIAFSALGRLDESVTSYRQAISCKPDYAAAYNNLGVALKAQGQLEAAGTHYARAIKLQPDSPDAYSNLGNVLYALEFPDAAEKNCRAAIALQPDHVEAHNNLANALRELKKTAEAEQHYLKALALKSDYPEALANLGHLKQDLGQLPQAVDCYRQALALQPDYPEARGLLFYLQRQQCDWRGYALHMEKIVEDIAAGKSGYGPFAFLSVTDSAKAQLQCAQSHARQNRLTTQTPLWTGQRYGQEKIRVAYVSADFREHAVAYLTAGLFERHDKNRFVTIGVSLAADDNSTTGLRLRRAFCHYHDASRMSAREIAQLLRDLEIDIAVDLMGYTKHAKPGIFAYRPAPVQINYLGFPATMGAACMDYVIADQYLIPEAYQDYYAEKPVYMPDCFQANDAGRYLPKNLPPRTECGLPESAFVFCSFNNSYKITPEFFTVWMRLLAKVPGSVLWLVASNPAVPDNLRREARQRGIDPERLIFAPKLPYAEHLTRLQAADLFLDTLPFNAGTTASDALWAGVPVLTCSGAAFAARMAGSLLHAVGLPELITDTLEDYENLAFKLAATPSLLTGIRRKLAENRSTSPLFDTRRFCRHLEAAYLAMHDRAVRGKSPAGINVSSSD